jgi:DnaJ-class molecular chaperone
MGKNKHIKVGSVYYPDTEEGRKQAADAFRERHKAWLSELRKRRKYGRFRRLDSSNRS